MITKFSTHFLNVKFWIKILGCHNVVVKWIHQTGFWTKHFCETQNAECLWEVNQFSEWIQAFWTFLNQNSAFSHSSNMHHILEFCTSCWYSVAKWLWKKPHVLWRKRCRYRFSLLCCQFPRQYRRFRHRRLWSFSHNINHIGIPWFLIKAVRIQWDSQWNTQWSYQWDIQWSYLWNI